MPYLVNLVVQIDDNGLMEDSVKTAIRKAGGAVRLSECTRTSGNSMEQLVTVLIDETRNLPRVVRAVERVRRAAVVAVTEPREIRDLKRV